jgi:CheY-like chemotaxis protein
MAATIISLTASPTWLHAVQIAGSELAADAPPNTAPPDEFTQQLMSLARRGNRQLGDAISALTRTGHWPQVNQVLERVRKQKLSDQALLEVQQQIEPAVFAKLRLSGQLSENAIAALDSFATVADKSRQSPQRLQAAIEQLADQSPDLRLSAARDLVAGGNAAIAVLVAAAVAPEPPVDRAMILRAMLRLGPGGTAALRQLALYGTPTVRDGAVASLVMIDARTHVVDLLTALHCMEPATDGKQIAARQLAPFFSETPSHAVAIQELSADLERVNQAAAALENDDDTVVLWSVDDERSGVRFSKALAIHGAYRDAADAATRLRRIGGLTPRNISSALIAEVGYRVLIDPDWGDPQQIDALRVAFGSAIDVAGLSDSIAAAIESHHHAAALGLIRMAGSVQGTGGRDLLFHGAGAAPTPLVRAAMSPNVRVRYEAALVAARLAAGQPYAGSSEVRQTLFEMTQLTDLPTAIIVETRPEVIATLQNVIARLGYSSELVGDAAQLQRRVDRGGDIRLLISKTGLVDLAPLELVDVLRRTSRGRELPILFYQTEPLTEAELTADIFDPALQNQDWRRGDGPIQWIERPVTTAAYAGILDRVARQRRLPALSTIDRQRFRREAGEILAAIRDGDQ